jgi:hypothetical protein
MWNSIIEAIEKAPFENRYIKAGIIDLIKNYINHNNVGEIDIGLPRAIGSLFNDLINYSINEQNKLKKLINKEELGQIPNIREEEIALQLMRSYPTAKMLFNMKEFYQQINDEIKNSLNTSYKRFIPISVPVNSLHSLALLYPKLEMEDIMGKMTDYKPQEEKVMSEIQRARIPRKSKKELMEQQQAQQVRQAQEGAAPAAAFGEPALEVAAKGRKRGAGRPAKMTLNINPGIENPVVPVQGPMLMTIGGGKKSGSNLIFRK